MQIENSVTQDLTVWHHSATFVMSNSYPCKVIVNPHLKTIKESYRILPNKHPSLTFLSRTE